MNQRRTPVGRITVGMHRWLLAAPPELDVDHKNGNGLDNRRENLRLVTHAQNIATGTGSRRLAYVAGQSV